MNTFIELYQKKTLEESSRTRKKRKEIRKLIKKTGLKDIVIPEGTRILEIHGGPSKLYIRTPYGEDVDTLVNLLPSGLWKRLNSGITEYGFKSKISKNLELEVYTYNVTCEFEEEDLPQEEWVTKRNVKKGCTPSPKPQDKP
jgi:hypothetical protein